MTCSRHCGFEGRGIAQRTDTGTRTLPLTQKPFSGTMIVIGESIACYDHQAGMALNHLQQLFMRINNGYIVMFA